MACNPEEGILREINEVFPMEKAKELGYTQIFKVGDVVQIQGVFFKVVYFHEGNNTMTIKCISKVEAKSGLSNMLKELTPKELTEEQMINLRSNLKAEEGLY